MAWNYIEGKKYSMLLEQLRTVAATDLDPNVATTEEMETCLFEYLPPLVKSLQELYKKAIG